MRRRGDSGREMVDGRVLMGWEGRGEQEGWRGVLEGRGGSRGGLEGRIRRGGLKVRGKEEKLEGRG